eukprot:COSAG06_NODE_33025_length_496_cov_1.763224_1_plen_36_part_10
MSDHDPIFGEVSGGANVIGALTLTLTDQMAQGSLTV